MRLSVERVVGPSLIVLGTIGPLWWGWVYLYAPLLALQAYISLAFVIVVVELCAVGALSCLAYCLLADPGSTRRWRARAPFAESVLCKVCALPRPADDAHHCRTCDLCVIGHDHHCCVLGICIAEGNRRVFIALLAFGTMAYASMAVLAMSTGAWLDAKGRTHGQRGEEEASFMHYALASAGFLLGALVLGAFCTIQIICVRLGLRFKTPGLLALIARELSGGGDAPISTAAKATRDHADADGADEGEPGCLVCLPSCIDAHHEWGLGGVVPGASLLTGGAKHADSDAEEAANTRRVAAAVALIELVTAAYLSGVYSSRPVVALASVVLAAFLSVHCIRELERFQTSRDQPHADPMYFPPPAALVQQPKADAHRDVVTQGDGHELAEDLLDDATDHPAVTRQLLKRGGPGIEWCAQCQLYVRRPSAHCSKCGRCVAWMDHHCKLLRVCVGSHNRRTFSLLLASALALMTIYLLIALNAMPPACAQMAELYPRAREAATHAESARGLLSSLATLASTNTTALSQCIPPTALAFFCAYASWALFGFGLQQVLFVVLVQEKGRCERRGVTPECCDWRSCLLRSGVCHTYWRRQREQLLREFS